MQLIVITGPSGSGKTFLSKRIATLFENSIIINTDSYYKDNLLIKLISKFKYDIYDRLISIKYKELINTINSIENKEEHVYLYDYDFKSKVSRRFIKHIKNHKDKIIILEGIFSHRLKLNYKNAINIVCNEKKEICYHRRVNRDKLERAREIKEINNRFIRSWDLYHHNSNRYTTNNTIILVSPDNELSYKKLIRRIKHKLFSKKAKENK
tara:strand:+ start:4987 stop:5616 length:630 start_codon:yes stop_codon:yes gene_type:complete